MSPKSQRGPAYWQEIQQEKFVALLEKSGKLRDALFGIVTVLYKKHYPLPKNWQGAEIKYASGNIAIQVSTDFREYTHLGASGVCFRMHGTVGGQNVNYRFFISRRQLEIEKDADEAFGNEDVRCPAKLKLA